MLSVQLKAMRIERKSLWIGLAMLFLWGCSPEHEAVPLDPLAAGRTDRPNDFLVCPAGYCENANATASVYEIDADGLFERWLAVIGQAPRTRIVGVDPDQRLVHAEQRSQIFRFVDTALVRVVEVDQGASFVAYSRSELGYSDMGVNQERLEGWMAALDASVSTD